MSTCEFGFVHPSASQGKDCFIEASLAFSKCANCSQALHQQDVPHRPHCGGKACKAQWVAACLRSMRSGAANTATKQSTKRRSTAVPWFFLKSEFCLRSPATIVAPRPRCSRLQRPLFCIKLLIVCFDCDTDWDGVRSRNVCFTSLGGMGAPAYDSDFQGLPFLTSDFIWGTGSKQSVVQLSKWKNVCGDKVLDHYTNVKGESVKPSLQKLLNIATDMGPSFDSCTPSEWAIRADVQKALKKIGWKAEHIVEAIKANDL
eukprot:g40859.t1